MRHDAVISRLFYELGALMACLARDIETANRQQN